MPEESEAISFVVLSRACAAAALKSALSRAPRDLTRVAALQIDRREAVELAAVAAEHRWAQKHKQAT